MSAESPAPPADGLPAWSMTTALAFVVLWFLLLLLMASLFQLAAVIVLAVSEGLSLEDASREILRSGAGSAGQAVMSAGVVLFAWAATFALIRKLLRAFPRTAIREALGLVRPAPRWALAAGAIAGFVLAIVGNVILYLLRASEDETPIQELLSTPAGVAAVAVMALGIAPFAEETFFRGFVYPPMARRFSLGTAMALNGAVFAVVHLATYGNDLAFLPPIFLLGFVLAGMRSWTGSTWPSIIAHFVFNGTALAAWFLAPGPSTGT